MTKRSRALLDKKRVAYTYIDIDKDRTAAKWVADRNGGKEKKPTIDIDGKILVEPTDRELEAALV